jgi:ABC-2 type transport system ATP-binding protein
MYVLEAIDIRARYGKRTVLEAVTLTVARGEWFCLLGPNGVGKSTLLHCVAGRVIPAGGALSICGQSIVTDPSKAKRHLGFACAPDQLPGLLTGRQCLEVYALAKQVDTLDADVMALAEQLRFSGFLDQCVDTYSLGTRQKLCVLLAFLGNPDLIVLDEAFNGLDPASAMVLKRHLKKRLAEGRCGVLLATHSLDIVEHYADKAALLLDGRIAQQWTKAQMSALRALGGDRFEEALAQQAAPVTT